MSKPAAAGFMLTTLAAWDQLYISIGGSNAKINVAIFALWSLYLLTLSSFVISRRILASLVLFLAIALLSALQNLLTGGSYIDNTIALYIIYTIVVMGCVPLISIHYAREDCDAFINGILISLVVQVFLAAAYWHYSGQSRAAFTYYEPSYFALAMIPYYCYAFRCYLTRGLLCTRTTSLLVIYCLFLWITKSADAMLASAVSALVVAILALCRDRGVGRALVVRRLLLCVLVFLAIGFVAGTWLVLYQGDDLLIRTVKKLFSSGDIWSFLVARAGDRFYRIILAWNVWLENYWFGVGLGQYVNYIAIINSPLYANPWWTNPAGLPAINMYLQLGATVGVFGLAAFILYVCVFLQRLVSVRELGEKELIIVSAVITFLLVINFENSYLRAYFWVWAGAAVAYAYSNSLRNSASSATG